MKFSPNTKVRLRSNPAKVGTITALPYREMGGSKLIHVDFGNTQEWMLESNLEVSPTTYSLQQQFKEGQFGPPSSLRKSVILERLKGQITNMFYSMNVSSADFLPYQFKPVLKFIESISGRILIADEVGLGKTVEAIYIWKELQARRDARRLLVLCPAVLREKWKNDLYKLFNITARLVGAKELLEIINRTENNPLESFNLIASLEGVRSKFDPDGDEEATSNQDKITKVLSEYLDKEGESNIFDLVIIDEAHYLRNPATASHKTAVYIRDNTEHLVLLSATPVQTSSNNLFQLLKLLAPDDYYDFNAFQEAVDDNKPILDTIAAINSKDANYMTIANHYSDLEGLIDEKLRARILKAYKNNTPDIQTRVDISWQLSEYSYLNEYMVRTRKKEVLSERVIRNPHTVLFKLTEREKEIYELVSREVRSNLRLSGKKGQGFVLTLRQRHMASCLPMGVKASRGSLENLIDEFESEYFDEDILNGNLPEEDAINLNISDDLINELKSIDSKYKSITQNLRNEVFASNRDEKVIIFSFFRSTVEYLQDRLEKDGFSVARISGGMGNEKYEVLEEFESPEGPNILLSTEVGAEGLDLQFARVLINYDLPWNPMRVEQRIGRIDRIGQKSEMISIFNMVCENTIEDRVLARLYERINIFKGTIGDLDEILGNEVEDLMLEVINEDLSEEQALDRADDTAQSMIINKRNRDDLEEQSINLLGFNDFIMQTISDARNRDRFIVPTDLTQFVDDFFQTHYRGTKFSGTFRDNNTLRLISLSSEARDALGNYVTKNPSTITTRLMSANTETLCVFDSRYDFRSIKGKRYEVIELKHPLIQWILEEYKGRPEDVYPCTTLKLKKGFSNLPLGQYVFFIQRWDSKGSMDRKELKYFVCGIENNSTIPELDQELLIKNALQYGEKWDDYSVEIDFKTANQKLDLLLEETMNRFTSYMGNLEIEHNIRNQKQIRYAKSKRDRRIASVEERIEKLIANKKSESVIRMTRGQIKHAEENYERQKAKIDKSGFEPSMSDIAVGIIKVEE